MTPQAIGFTLFLAFLIGSFVYFIIIKGDKPTCPNCGQNKAKIIGRETKDVSSSMQGLFDLKVKVKESISYHCQQCRHQWEEELVS